MYNPRNPNINISANGVYQFSTQWYPTCKAALAAFINAPSNSYRGGRKVTIIGITYRAERAKS